MKFLSIPRSLVLLAGKVVLLAGMSLPAAAQSCPSASAAAVRQLNYTSDQLWSPQSTQLTAGGDRDLRFCGSVPGAGFVIRQADFALNFSGNQAGRALEIRARGTCDTVLLINDPSGRWHYVDDADETLHPRIRLDQARGGTYRIWVGTYNNRTCAATLTAETFGRAPGGGQPSPLPSSASCPATTGAGRAHLSYSSDQLWSPRTHQLIAGGNLNLRNCGTVPGVGHIVRQADFTLNFAGNQIGRALELRARGDCDTVLLINDPAGRWHFVDDADGSRDPRIRLPRAQTGTYRIWVGTYDSSTCHALLTAETF